jgi:hypothetical protein
VFASDAVKCFATVSGILVAICDSPRRDRRHRWPATDCNGLADCDRAAPRILRLTQMRQRHTKTWPIARPDRLIGTPSSRQLLMATIPCAVSLLAVVVLALPHDPDHVSSGLVDGLQRPVVLLPLGVLAVVGAVACIRGWMFRSLLITPGPIEVVLFEDATTPPPQSPVTAVTGPLLGPPADGAVTPTTVAILAHAPSATAGNGDGDATAPIVQLGMYFRQRLSDLRLTAPTATPGARTSVDFVDLLETSKIDPKQPFAAIGRVLRMVRPTHAYEVKAKLLRRTESPSFGVALEVIVLPQRRTTLRTYWRTTWEEALDRAARGVSAQVVPRSRHSDRGTWAGWRGLILDEKLFDLHHQAQRLLSEQRYEEALDHCYEAVRRDPGNGYLRYALGSMQEELALYLDAYLTYGAIPASLDVARDEHHRCANARVEFLAKYRQTILLGYGERLAEQWLPPPPEAVDSRRSEELRGIRERLRPVLKAAFISLNVDGADLERVNLTGDLSADLDELLDERAHLDSVEQRKGGLGKPLERSERHDNRARRERRLHVLFQLLAVGEVRKLLAESGEAALKHVDTGVTPTSLDLLPAWAEVRLRRARHLLHSEIGRRPPRGHAPVTVGGPAAAGEDGSRWPLTPDGVRELWTAASHVGGVSLQERLRTSTAFADHYNAACTYAIGLLPHRGRSEPSIKAVVDELAEAAVGELIRAADAGGSSMLASRWDRILSDEPDLDGLRPEPAFRRFETERLPSSRPAPVRPSSIVRLKASRHSARLAYLCAERLEAAWHARAAGEGATDIHLALEWWRDELGACRLARDLALHHRQWQTRLDVIHEMQAFAERNAMPPFRVVHPRYAEQPIIGDRETVERAARHETHFSDLRMSILAHALTPLDTGSLPGADAWGQHLVALDDTGECLPADTRKRLADNRAAVWGAMRQAFSEPPIADVAAREHFESVFTAAVRALETVPPVLPPTDAHATRQAAEILVAALRSNVKPHWPRGVTNGRFRRIPGRVGSPGEATTETAARDVAFGRPGSRVKEER